MRKVIHKYKAKVKRFKHEMYCINFMNIHINMESKIFNEQLKSCFMKSLKIYHGKGIKSSTLQR